MADQTSTNTLQTMPCLPSEVLCIIFEKLEYNAKTNDLKPTTAGRLGWLAATHVCRSWRNAAIGHKVLWHNITTTRPGLFKMFSRRAGHLPLSIFGEPVADYTRSRAYFIAFMTHFERIRDLEIHAGDDSKHGAGLPGRLLLAFDEVRDTLMLETLTLDFSGPWTYNLPANLLKRAPNLCEVELTRISFPNPVSHSGLRFLHICDCDKNTLANIYGTLRGLPNLVSVILDSAWNSRAFTHPDSDIPLIVLPRLRSLTLKNAILSSACLLQYVQMHPRTYVHLESSKILDYIPWDNDMFMNCLRLYFERHPMPAAVSVCVEQSTHTDPDGPGYFKVNASFIARRARTRIRLSTLNLLLTPGFRINAKIMGMVLLRPDLSLIDPTHLLLSSSAFSPASWISVTLRGTGFCLSSAHFIDMFHAATNIQDVVLHEVKPEIMEGFFTHLTPTLVRHIKPDLPNPVLLPNLQTVTLEGIPFFCFHDDSCLEACLLTDAIGAALKDRNTIGHPIKRIFLRMCTGINEEVHVKELSDGFGCTVHWDGHGRAGHGDEEVVERLEALAVS